MSDSANERLREGISKKDARIVQEALDAGAEPNAPLFGDASPLHLAATLGPAAVVGCLIKAGADVHAVDTYKRTPLHYAAITIAREGPQIIDALLSGDASVNAEDYGGGTPLDTALIARADAHARPLHAAGGRCTTHETRQRLRKLLRSISEHGTGPGSAPG